VTRGETCIAAGCLVPFAALCLVAIVGAAAAQSYAGNYVLELAQVVAHANEDIMSDIEAGLEPKDVLINMRGIGVGNPTMDWTAGANAYLPFISYHGLISAQDLAEAILLCNNTFQPPPTQACSDLVANLTLNVYGINPYNVEDLCRGGGWGSTPGCFTMDSLNAFARPTPLGFDTEFPSDSSKGMPLSQTFVPCIDLTPIRTYMNSPAVMDALHIPPEEVVLPWDACSSALHYS
jgi:hypothetical protein